MVYLSKVGNSYNIPAQHYICDTNEDFEELKENTAIPIGSTCLVIEEQATWEKGESDWCILSSGGGGGTTIIKVTEKIPLASEVHKEGGRF